MTFLLPCKPWKPASSWIKSSSFSQSSVTYHFLSLPSIRVVLKNLPDKSGLTSSGSMWPSEKCLPMSQPLESNSHPTGPLMTLSNTSAWIALTCKKSCSSKLCCITLIVPWTTMDWFWNVTGTWTPAELLTRACKSASMPQPLWSKCP